MLKQYSGSNIFFFGSGSTKDTLLTILDLYFAVEMELIKSSLTQQGMGVYIKFFSLGCKVLLKYHVQDEEIDIFCHQGEGQDPSAYSQYGTYMIKMSKFLKLDKLENCQLKTNNYRAKGN